ncbi:hypothetical protein MW887_009709 [Aspergillus wentii]|nr:hypothetical protein MW887_009709 [Aspergillus wentii]
MEAPALDDTMEMGSPYLGQADDFEIDLDVMEDQASNADKDMTVDDYPEPSHEAGYNQDSTNDADMADDITESAMVDADEKYPEENYGVDMQYGDEETYEAEMLEDDYDEDIDAPVPDSHDQVSVTLEDANNEDIEGKAVTGEADGTAEDNHEKPAPEPSLETKEDQPSEHIEEPHVDIEKHDDHDTENTASVANLDQNRTRHAEESFGDTHNAEQIDLQPKDSEGAKNEQENVQQPEEEGHVAQETQPAVGETQYEEARPVENAGADEAKEETVDTVQDAVSLHPVKVYYQDNEISLFPPREGDSSETFFLEDESLAFKTVNKLLESCREVLREHIGENEILVIDVDCLNIQLTEDSLHLSKVTLHQIVDLYLRLCHNDGMNEPDALYLSLSTKLSTPAEIADLVSAAYEGKGLSEIHLWDDYDEAELEAEPVSTEVHEEEYQEAHHEAPAPDTENQEHIPQPKDSEQISAETETNGDVQNTHDEQKEEQQPEGLEKPSSDQNEAASLDADEEAGDENYTNVPHDQEPEEVRGEDVSTADNLEGGKYTNVGHNVEPENDHNEGVSSTGNDLEDGELDENVDQEPEVEHEAGDYHSPNEGSYDSEGQKTESTATIGHFPAGNLAEEQQYGDESTNVSHNGQASHESHEDQGDHNDYYAVEDTGDGNYDEEEVNVDPSEHHEDLEAFEEHDAGDAYDDDEEEEEAEGDVEHLQDPSQSYETNETDHGDENEPASAPEENRDVAVESNQHDSESISAENLESRLDNTSSDMPANEPRATPEPADDLLGIEDDVLQSPLKDLKSNTEEVKNQPDSGESRSDETEHATTANAPDDNAEDLIFDNEEYIDLGITESIDDGETEPSAPDSKVPDSTSTKRAREPEDELDLSGSPSPDVKRTRSS